MKGMISGIKRMEIHDGDGLRTTVFFKGCPLKCIWCHNPDSISFAPQTAFFKEKCIGCGFCGGRRNQQTAQSCPASAQVYYGTEYEVDELVEILLQDKDFFDNSGGGVTLSGGECLAQPDFAVELAKALQETGVSVFIDTCGFVPRKTLEKILPYADKFLYDIKAIDPKVHKNLTGQDNALILENLKFLVDMGCNIEVRYPLVKGFNDGECEKIGKLLQELKYPFKIKVLQYHRFAASRYEALGMQNTLPNVATEPADVENAVAILKGFGLNAINGVTEN
ncbi:MAG: glycyl-radical enzyme activating protein [Clostridia bacterium]|nr:glycyl-radical enzyme activating protein [Clostridia bacterium]